MHFRSLRRVGVTVGLAGCISMFQAGKSAALLYYNMAYPQYNGDVINGRDIQQCGNNPCQSMPCKYGGICLMADKESYQCVCRDGFSGRYFPACLVNMAGFALWQTRNRTSVCRDGFSGRYFPACLVNMAGFALMEDKESYQCLCRDRFSGRCFTACPVNIAEFALR